MKTIFERTISKVCSKLQQSFIKICCQIQGIASITGTENETTESKKAIYLLSLILLISLIFLSPDKIPQALSPTHADVGILEKAQEITKIIKKLLPNIA